MSHPVPEPRAVLRFLREVHLSGHASVQLTGAGVPRECLRHMEAEAAADPAVGALLREWHAAACEDLAGPAPVFDEAAARWGAAMLFRAAWFYLHRDAPEQELLHLLSVPPPVPPGPAAILSADVSLRWLPDIHRMALALAPGDPLLALLQNLAAAHPLSGAALPPAEGRTRTPEPAAWAVLLAHPGLWRLFIDRVIAAGARWWLHLPEVRAAIRGAAGAYAAELVPALDLSEPSPASHESSHT